MQRERQLERPRQTKTRLAHLDPGRVGEELVEDFQRISNLRVNGVNNVVLLPGA